jgi:hypothetical protein
MIPFFQFLIYPDRGPDRTGLLGPDQEFLIKILNPRPPGRIGIGGGKPDVRHLLAGGIQPEEGKIVTFTHPSEFLSFPSGRVPPSNPIFLLDIQMECILYFSCKRKFFIKCWILPSRHPAGKDAPKAL